MGMDLNQMENISREGNCSHCNSFYHRFELQSSLGQPKRDFCSRCSIYFKIVKQSFLRMPIYWVIYFLFADKDFLNWNLIDNKIAFTISICCSFLEVVWHLFLVFNKYELKNQPSTIPTDWYECICGHKPGPHSVVECEVGRLHHS